MSDDRELARQLFDVLLADEPPADLDLAGVAAAGRRHRLRSRSLGGGAALAAAAGVAAVVGLAVTAGPAPDGPPATRPAPSVLPTPPPRLSPTEEPPGGIDVLTPQQEAWLVAHDSAAFDRAYRAPAGWRVVKRVPFLSDPGISDEVWNGGVDVADSAGRVANVAVAVARYRSGTADCLAGRETVPLPGGGTAHVTRPDTMLVVCWQRPDGVVVTAMTARGAFLPDGSVRDAPVLPETPARLAALVADPGFAWPS
jgi:hypothetical protein